MTEKQEMEHKYLIKGENPDQEESVYANILQETKTLERIKEYSISRYQKKERNYRYFDTFDIRLTQSEVLAYIGPLEEKGITASLREREGNYVLTVKFPKSEVADERDEFEFLIPFSVSFDELNLEDFIFWPPLRQAKQYGGNKPLTEIVRLGVITHRFDLEQENESKVQISLDSVEVINPFIRKKFYELEVEKLEKGELIDVEGVCDFFTKKFNSLVYSPLPKWVKAQRLLRGEKIS